MIVRQGMTYLINDLYHGCRLIDSLGHTPGEQTVARQSQYYQHFLPPLFFLTQLFT